MERVQTARISAIGVDLVRILDGMDRGVEVPVPAVDEIADLILDGRRAAA